MAPEESVSVIQPNCILDCYAVLVRQTVRDIFLVTENVPILDCRFQRLSSLTFAEVGRLQLCTDECFHLLDRTFWT